MEKTADAIVVGAGVMGTSIAFQLTLRGIKRVMVLEKQAVGAGSTGKSSGLVRMHYTFMPEARLAHESYQWFTHWAERVGGQCGFVQTGFVRIVAPAHIEALKKNVALLQQIGIHTYLITAEELRSLDPAICSEDVPLAAYEPGSGYADPYATALSFINAAKERGAMLYQGVQVTHLHVAHGKVQGVTTTQGRIDSPLVISAAGPWTKTLLQTAGLDLPLWPSRHQVAVLERPVEIPSHMTYIDGALNMYFRPEGSGLTLVGTDPHQDHVDPDHYQEHTDPEYQAVVADKIPKRIPQMDRAGLRRGIAGVYTMSPDGKCILDRIPGVEGLFLAAGFSGTGFKISPAVGIAMAELALEGKASTVDITPFSLTRFTEGKRLQGEYEYRDRPYDQPVEGLQSTN